MERAADAANEPLLWRDPWRPALVVEISSSFSKLCSHLRNLGDQVGDDAAAQQFALFGLETFKPVRLELIDAVAFTVELASFVLNEASKVSCSHIAKLESHTANAKSKHTDAASGEIASLPNMLEEMNAITLATSSPTKQRVTKLHLDDMSVSSQQCVIVCTLSALMDTLRRTQRHVVTQKSA